MSTVIIQSRLARRIALTVCMCLVPTSVLAQDAYPNRAIKIIAPVGAGSVADLVPRFIAEKLAGRWGIPVYVENRPGGNTNIGAEAAARAEPDGYTLLAAPATTLAVNPSLFPKLTFDLTAFVPVTVLADQPNVLVANPKLPFSTVQGLIAFAKANPGKLTYASPGVGSVQHLSMELLASMTGIALVHVPYKDLPEAVNDVVGGHVDLLFDNLGSAAALIKNGNLKAHRRRQRAAQCVSARHAVSVRGGSGISLRHLVRRRCATQDSGGDRREAVCSHRRNSQDS